MFHSLETVGNTLLTNHVNECIANQYAHASIVPLDDINRMFVHISGSLPVTGSHITNLFEVEYLEAPCCSNLNCFIRYSPWETRC